MMMSVIVADLQNKETNDKLDFTHRYCKQEGETMMIMILYLCLAPYYFAISAPP